MIWKDYLISISKECQFKAPATEADISLIARELDIDLPKKMADLYKETNGVFGNYGISYFWSTEQMVKENLLFRAIDKQSNSMSSLDTFLFFSDAGNGNLFGYSITNGRIRSDEIYVWNHEDDCRRVIAPSLEEFIKGWILGEISV